MEMSRCTRCGHDVLDRMPEDLCPFCLLTAGRSVDYTIVNILGRGAHGTIYLAEQQPTHRLVTVKVLRDVSATAATVERLRRNRHALDTWSHPNVARLIETGLTNDRRPYLIREYVRGLPITVHCERSRSDQSARQRLLVRVADVIAQAHDRGMTHGGIRPSNVFIVSRAGEAVVKVLDFGERLASPADDIAALDRLTAELL